MPFSSPGIAIALSSGLPFPDPGTELPSTCVINTSIALALCQALYYTSHGNSNQAFSMCPFTRGENGGPGWLRACWVAGSRGGACTWPWSRRRATSVPVVCVCLLATSLSDTRAWAPQILTMGLLCTFRTKVQNTGSSCYKVSQGPGPPRPSPGGDGKVPMLPPPPQSIAQCNLHNWPKPHGSPSPRPEKQKFGSFRKG